MAHKKTIVEVKASYLFAAASSFGWQKTMIPSLTVTGIATYMALVTGGSNSKAD